ncbi:MAG: hypothetical protein AAF433_02360 [Bacteroidota bacterium]
MFDFIHRIPPRTFFLVDGLGALISAFLLGVVLVKWEHLFGMPVVTLYYLALAAGAFMVYSLSCYLFFPKNWRPLLRLIALVNLSYCALTLSLLFYHQPQLTVWGNAYFILEIILVATLAFLELRVAKRSSAA